MMYRDNTHEEMYQELCSRMKSKDCYHRAMAYLLSLDEVLREHIEAVFDFQRDGIKRDGLHKDFQTGTSMKTTRLAMNYLLVINDHPPIIIHEEDRKEYYSALDEWDTTLRLEPLTDFLKQQTVKTWTNQLGRAASRRTSHI